ncbi:hypothetical protein D7X55_09735 [Corallococcus sp. AB049A]|uniref:hypothetical protein n=1 Tax=Corallococcus TaxID=83461 RepID=UPI000ECA82FD|nr:hypothetical protein [Corallococcus sp. AB049A]RKI70759.1 hypothetical protein D7X55_09735 [Corallococcus sp. AB049A]
MFEFFMSGGIAMYPTLLFGFLLVACSILFLFRPEPRYLASLLGLGATTGSAGMLGFCLGLMNSLRYLHLVPPAEQFQIAALGCEESLHPLVLALVLLVIAGLFVSIGAVRAMGLFHRTPAS